MTYTITDKVIEKNRRSTDWEQRLEIVRLRNQGWGFSQIGDKLGITKQAVYYYWKKTKDMSVEELENMVEKYQ